MADQFPLLLSPFQIGRFELKNRIVFLPHLVQYAENHFPSEQERYYYEERAHGGVALIIYGCMTVQARSNLVRDCFAFDERVLSGFKAIADGVHKHGAYIFAQIIHYGNQSATGVTLEDEDWKPLLAPSPVADGLIQEMPKEMEEEDFQAIKEGYVRAARNILRAGMDGIEVNMGHASLLRQFLSPHTNKRKDQYGGSLENRSRFPKELLKSVRGEVGDQLCIAVRLCQDEFLPDGITLNDSKKIAKEFEDTGLVDLMISDMGIYTSPHIMDPPMAVPLGYAVYTSSTLKEAVNLPVVAFGRITDPFQAENILSEGHADLIGMARQLICDPEFPRKVVEGRVDDIRVCMGCNQGCFGRVWKNLSITCTHNPAAGREKLLGTGTLKSAHSPKKVVVVGGGPAGMKAAEVASRRGHHVVLFEKDEELGGKILIFTKIPNRENFIECVRYLSTQIKKLPIELVLGQEADKNLILSLNPDVVIIASGATPHIPYIPGADLPHVGSVSDLLLGNFTSGERIAIIDTEGFWTSINAAEFLLDQGKKVEIITPHLFAGMNLDLPSLFALNLNLFPKGLVVVPNTALTEIAPNHIKTIHLWSNEQRDIRDIDTVVMATGFTANDGLYQSLKRQVNEIYRVGDCLAPRRADHAIWDGEQVGRLI